MKKRTDKKSKHKEKDEGALFVPAGVLLGVGFGFLYNVIVAGLFIGLGTGFALYGLVQAFSKKKK